MENLLQRVPYEQSHLFYEQAVNFHPAMAISTFHDEIRASITSGNECYPDGVQIIGDLKRLIVNPNSLLITGGHFTMTDGAVKYLQRQLGNTDFRGFLMKSIKDGDFHQIHNIHALLRSLILDVQSWAFLEYTHRNGQVITHDHQDPRELIFAFEQMAFCIACKIFNPNLVIMPSGGRNRIGNNLMPEGDAYKLISLWMLTDPDVMRMLSNVNVNIMNLIDNIVPETAAASTKLNAVYSMMRYKIFIGAYPENVGFITLQMKVDRVADILEELSLQDRAVIIGIGKPHEESFTGEKIEGMHNNGSNVVLERIALNLLNGVTLDDYINLGFSERMLLTQLILNGNLKDYYIPLPWNLKRPNHRNIFPQYVDTHELFWNLYKTSQMQPEFLQP